jgi:hypothetical protein
MADGSRSKDTGIIFRVTAEQREQLRVEADDVGLSLQALLEFKLFGEIAPRQRKRRDAQIRQQERLIA